jgi:ligand-binding sensor domain-containing protein
MKNNVIAVLLWTATSVLAALSDTPFVQEYRTEIAYPDNAGAVRSLTVTQDGSVWLAAKTGVYRYADGRWRKMQGGSAYALVSRGGDVFAGTWDGLYRIHEGAQEKILRVRGPVVALWADARGVVAASQDALYLGDGNTAWSEIGWRGPRGIRSLVRDGAGGIWIGSTMGAYYRGADGALTEYHEENELVSGEVRSVALLHLGDHPKTGHT